MLNRATTIRRWPATILLAALLLRCLIPLGYMPAALDSGWFAQLCPDDLSAPAMRALLGDEHQHHRSHQAGDSGTKGPELWTADCALAGFSLTWVPVAEFDRPAALPLTTSWVAQSLPTPSRPSRGATYQSRAPPLSSVQTNA